MFRKRTAALRAEWCRLDKRAVFIGAGILLGIGLLSALLTFLLGGNFRVYNFLRKPSFAPPRFLFPIIWTVLYPTIGGAAGAVYSQKRMECDKYRGLFLFVIMTAFNFIWSPLFFAADAYFLALIDLALMLVFSLFTAWYFYKLNVLAGIAICIYILWLAIAFLLNLSIILLN